MHKVAILALNGVVPLDLGIACQIFGFVRGLDNSPLYALTVCGETELVQAGLFQMKSPANLDQIAHADTVIIPGIEDPSVPIAEPVLDSLQAAWRAGARIASICSGAFVLAATGLLDGRRATTHWLGTAELKRRYPAITVDPDVLFVDEGRIVTSAGASAGLDMCLHLVRRDHGQSVAAEVARMAVAPLDREGGQSQFIRYEPPTSRASLAPLLEWMLKHRTAPLDVSTLAARAGLSPRTFARRFREQTGTTPVQWLLAARVRLAQELLEAGGDSIEEIAAASGFDSAVTFRARFQRLVGIGPTAYRQRFNARGASRARSRPKEAETRVDRALVPAGWIQA